MVTKRDERQGMEGIWWAPKEVWHENKGQKQEGNTDTQSCLQRLPRGFREHISPTSQSCPDCTTSPLGILSSVEISDSRAVCIPCHLPLPG